MAARGLRDVVGRREQGGSKESMSTHDDALTQDWSTIETALAKVEIPDFWEALPSEDDRVLMVAERTGRKTTFRANLVVVVRPSSETVEQLGARSVAEALALPGWSHVVADKEWLYPGLTGRYVKFLYEASGCAWRSRAELSSPERR
jgi:hypothetical protein